MCNKITSKLRIKVYSLKDKEKLEEKKKKLHIYKQTPCPFCSICAITKGDNRTEDVQIADSVGEARW